MNKKQYGLVATTSIFAMLFVILATSSSMTTTVQSSAWVNGHITLTAYDNEGNIFAYQQTDNLINDVGLDCIADQMFPDIDLCTGVDAEFAHIQIGTGTTSPVAGDTDIETGACGKVLDATVTATSAVGGEFTATVDAPFDGGTCAGAITEAGVFNSITNATGEMLARSTFGAVNISAGDTLTVSYDITVT